MGARHSTCSSQPDSQNIMPAKKSTKKVAAKKSAVKSAPAQKASVAKKTAAKPAPKKAAAPSLDAIAKAAYLNYRRRTEQGLPGDNHSDWHEAERSVTKG